MIVSIFSILTCQIFVISNRLLARNKLLNYFMQFIVNMSPIGEYVIRF